MTLFEALLLTKYLQSDWSRRIQYWLHCTLDLNVLFFEKKNRSTKNLIIKINKLFISYKLFLYIMN